MTGFTFTYQPPTEENPRHIWSLAGPLGGIHIHATEAQKEIRFMGEKFIGGIEVHSRTPMYSEHKGHENCWLIGGTCYHDGSSLYFSEYIEPRLRYQPFDEGTHGTMSAILHDWYRSHFESEFK